MRADPHPATRWIIVAVTSLTLALAAGQITNGFSVFFIPLETEYGWSRGAIAFVNTAGLLGVAVGGIVMGAVADRSGIRWIYVLGVAALGLPVLLASQVTALWQFYLLYAIAGTLGAGALTAPLTALVGSWFRTGAGLALGITAAVQALGQGGVPFATTFLIEGIGWRGALAVQGLATLALLPLALLIRRPPPADAASPAAAAAETRPPIPPNLLVAAMSLAALGCCTCMSVPLMHLVPLIEGRGFSAPQAGNVLFLMLIAAIGGRVAFGALADRTAPLFAWFAASAWQTALVFFFTQVPGLGGLTFFAMIYGFGYGGVMTGVLVSVSRLVPPSRRAASLGIVLAFAFAGHGLGGFQGGLFFDLTGSYSAGYLNAVFAGLANLSILAALIFTLRRRTGSPLAA